MREPTLRVLLACPCCGQSLRRGWRREPRWGRLVQFNGPGQIVPLDTLPIEAPVALVREVAAVATWDTAPDNVAAGVFSAADVLARAGWPK